MTTAAAIIERGRAARERLWTPVDGRLSSDLEVVSDSGKRLIALQEMRNAKTAERIAAGRRLDALMAYKAACIRLVIIVHATLVHSRPQPNNEPPLIDATCVWPVTIRDIARAACRKFEVNMLDFVSHRRGHNLNRPRQITMYLAREMTTRSFPQIAKIMDRDHTSILHGWRKVSRLIADGDVSWIADVESVRSFALEGYR